MQLSIGSFYPNLLLSGILWPLEGMPPALQYVAKFLPNTLACQVNYFSASFYFNLDYPNYPGHEGYHATGMGC